MTLPAIYPLDRWRRVGDERAEFRAKVRSSIIRPVARTIYDKLALKARRVALRPRRRPGFFGRLGRELHRRASCNGKRRNR